jgi:hypothetical protein
MAAAYWQQHYYSLSEQQQALLSSVAAASAEVSDDKLAELTALDQLSTIAEQLFSSCMQLLHVQIRTLWGSECWQPQLQLLQQGGGEVLLQGLTLAVHCSSLHGPMRTAQVFSVPGVVETVYQSVAGAHGCSNVFGDAASSVCLQWTCAHVLCFMCRVGTDFERAWWRCERLHNSSSSPVVITSINIVICVQHIYDVPLLAEGLYTRIQNVVLNKGCSYTSAQGDIMCLRPTLCDSLEGCSDHAAHCCCCSCCLLSAVTLFLTKWRGRCSPSVMT